MLSDWKVSQIERMLRVDRLSQRETARRCGVSRGAVRSVAMGQRRRRTSLEEDDLSPNGPPQRCPECGSQVFMPCLRCQLRNMIRENRLPRYSLDSLTSLHEVEEMTPSEKANEMTRIAEIAKMRAARKRRLTAAICEY